MRLVFVLAVPGKNVVCDLWTSVDGCSFQAPAPWPQVPTLPVTAP
ncbi:hypothetical protein XHC_2890 [Xanthomonas hortorum pv. carotae str. M081]|nr:hypothetical protein XHC_2890 [Xanthomonas hortorum pv. carotae str. M081]